MDRQVKQNKSFGKKERQVKQKTIYDQKRGRDMRGKETATKVDRQRDRQINRQMDRYVDKQISKFMKQLLGLNKKSVSALIVNLSSKVFLKEKKERNKKN